MAAREKRKEQLIDMGLPRTDVELLLQSGELPEVVSKFLDRREAVKNSQPSYWQNFQLMPALYDVH